MELQAKGLIGIVPLNKTFKKKKRRMAVLRYKKLFNGSSCNRPSCHPKYILLKKIHRISQSNTRTEARRML